MDMAKIIKERREAMHLTQEELANELGLQKSAIAKYENGRVENIKRSVIKRMAEVLKCSPSYLLGLDSHDSVKIPVYGKVAAGAPIEAIENIIEYVDIPASWTGDYAALLIKGDSMAPKIEDGDIIIVRLQDDADSGEIVVAIVDGADATCKKLLKNKDGITLQPLNTAYEPIYFSQDNITDLPVRIWGKVVENRSRFKGV